MKKYFLFITIVFSAFQFQAQNAQDTLDIERVALAYIEAQHNPNPKLMENALHPRMVKDLSLEIKQPKKILYLNILPKT